MDMMLLGETVTAKESGQDNLGFWMPAGGNDGVAGCEVFFVTGVDSFEVHLDTKSSDQDDASAASIGSVVISSSTPQSYKFDVAAARDLVRYRVASVRGGHSVHLQFAQPLWQPN